MLFHIVWRCFSSAIFFLLTIKHHLFFLLFFQRWSALLAQCIRSLMVVASYVPVTLAKCVASALVFKIYFFLLSLMLPISLGRFQSLGLLAFLHQSKNKSRVNICGRVKEKGRKGLFWRPNAKPAFRSVKPQRFFVDFSKGGNGHFPSKRTFFKVESCDLLGVPKRRVSQLGSLQVCCDFLPALAAVPCETFEGGVFTVEVMPTNTRIEELLWRKPSWNRHWWRFIWSAKIFKS